MTKFQGIVAASAAVDDMRRWRRAGIAIAGVVMLLVSLPAMAEKQGGLLTPTFLISQAAAGKTIYAEKCASCHGDKLDNGEFAPPVSGDTFRRKWAEKSASAAFTYIMKKMPPTAPGSLDTDMTTNVLAYLLQQNTVVPSNVPLPSDPEALKKILMPTAGYEMKGLMAAGVALPPPPNPTPDPLDNITPVTEAMLRHPAQGDWLTWRRTPDDLGFSPLKQIDKTNVSRLRVAWAWGLPSGPNESAPLAHDGVLFVFGHGDVVQALDGATGDLLWEYQRSLPKGVRPSYKKSIALLGQHVFVATSDLHVVALDMKTGEVAWDSAIVPAGAKGFALNGGPLVAKGKVIVGTGGNAPGGNYIVAFDAETGKEAWRFATIPRPGDIGGNSWNGMPVDKRTGGTVWTPGSYDPESGLVYFGPSPTYDTAPLRDRIKDPNVTNDALFTDATVALNPDTGKLVWYYSHMPNDQWDYDYAFERQIFDMQVGGVKKHVVITAGKQAIYDVLEAKSGKYLTSMDLGLQDLVTSIDPTTGQKIIDREKMTPGDGTTKSMCPQSGGGKNWYPSAYDPTAKRLFVALNETCHDLVPIPAGEHGFLTTGVRVSLRPRPDSDGKYGRLEAVDLENKKAVWAHRERATITSGVLSTGGGLVFAGYLDRRFSAYDDATGKELWSVRLNDVPNSSPITYTAHGKQYIAVISGNGGSMAILYKSLTPEIKNSVNPNASVWVFEVGE